MSSARLGGLFSEHKNNLVLISITSSSCAKTASELAREDMKLHFVTDLPTKASQFGFVEDFS